MKKTITIVLAAIAMLIAVSCTDDMKTAIDGFRTRLSDMESLVSKINESYSNTTKLVTALEDHDMIRSVTTVKKDGKDTYLVTFVSGRTITLIQGIDGIAPILGIRKYDDGRYYWTVQYGTEEPQWLLSNLGLKIRASSLTPQMKIEDGWWQYSYDDGGTWTRLCQATGEDGTSVFRNISVSDNYVTFSMAAGGMFQIPTEAYFSRIIDRCNSFTSEMEAAEAVLAGVDTSVAVKSITQIMEGDELVGYTLVLKNGQEFNIRPGRDEQPFTFSIKRDRNDDVDYWTIKVGDDPETWVLKPDGERSRATGMFGLPHLSVRDTMEAFYFVYSFYPDIDNYQWLRDANGNLVAASTFSNLAMFKSVSVGAQSVSLTLANGKTVNLPLYYEASPTIEFRAPSGIEYNSATYLYSEVEANTEYTVDFKVLNIVAGLKVDAIGMDGANVNFVTASLSGSPAYGIIKFRTPQTFPEHTTTTRILVFMTWGSNTTMQVLEFKNRVSGD